MDLDNIYRDTKALISGHFLLSSGKHSDKYLQTARLLEQPKLATKIAYNLANLIKSENIEAVTICSPALGGLLAGYELAKNLNIRFIFTERKNKIMTLSRGFKIEKNEKIIICEDIITTGGSAMEVYHLLKNLGGNIVAFSSFANRGFCDTFNLNSKNNSTCKLKRDIPLISLYNFDLNIFSAEDCPLCKKNIEIVKPGSR